MTQRSDVTTRLISHAARLLTAAA